MTVDVPAQPFAFALDPDHCALVVIDMQRDFIEPGGFGASLGNDVTRLHGAIAPIAALLAAWRARGAADAAAMDAVNPLFIPRNHLVEEALSAAVERDDLAPFDALVAALARPFDDQPRGSRYASPPRAEERVLATFCGT